MTTDTTAKKNIQKLQRAIVDGLEDVKAQEIQVFDTEHLSSLFERVIIASGSSNRQTKALAASVRDAVRKAGFPKPRIEGEANGEWIIVDCAQAVVHIMQPGIRTYYHLEELWGEKPVRLKFGADKPPAKVVAKVAAVKAAGAKKGAGKVAPARASGARAAADPVAVTAVAAKPKARVARKVVATGAATDTPASAPKPRSRSAAKAPARKSPATKR